MSTEKPTAVRRKRVVRNRGPKRFCLCGCARRVKQHGNDYFSPRCVPLAVRSEAAKKGRANFARKRRAVLFRDVLRRIGSRVSREDLLATLMEVYRLAYQRGHKAATWKYRHQLESKVA